MPDVKKSKLPLCCIGNSNDLLAQEEKRGEFVIYFLLFKVFSKQWKIATYKVLL